MWCATREGGVIDVEFKEGKGSAYGDEEVQNETEG
jgi:hypothetical protein